MTGWIKISRDIQNHWVFKDPFYRWWSIILLQANFKENKITLGYKIYPIKIGQCANSLRTWARLFNCSTKQVDNFFKMLEDDNMISKKILGKGKQSTTLISINNYSKYQHQPETQEHTQEHTLSTTQEHTQGKRERGTTKEVKKDNNEKNEKNTLLEKEPKVKKFNFRNSLKNLKVDENLISEWLRVRKNKKLTNTETAFKNLEKEILKSKLEPNEAIKICVENSWGGFKSNWLKNIQINKSEKKQSASYSRNEAMEKIKNLG